MTEPHVSVRIRSISVAQIRRCNTHPRGVVALAHALLSVLLLLLLLPSSSLTWEQPPRRTLLGSTANRRSPLFYSVDSRRVPACGATVFCQRDSSAGGCDCCEAVLPVCSPSCPRIAQPRKKKWCECMCAVELTSNPTPHISTTPQHPPDTTPTATNPADNDPLTTTSVPLPPQGETTSPEPTNPAPPSNPVDSVPTTTTTRVAKPTTLPTPETTQPRPTATPTTIPATPTPTVASQTTTSVPPTTTLPPPTPASTYSPTTTPSSTPTTTTPLFPTTTTTATTTATAPPTTTSWAATTLGPSTSTSSPITTTETPVPAVGTGGLCSEDIDCISGVCRNGACYASAVCKALKHEQGSPFDRNRVNLVFVGSGFDNLTTWKSELDQVYAVFEGFPPFAPDNDRLNAFYVDELAPKFCHFFCHGVERLLCCRVSTARELANQCFPTGTNLQTVVVHADAKYGGAGYYSSNVATTSIHPRGPLVAIHELGHSLFELADEYSGGAGTSSSPNCESPDSGCPKWADLVPFGLGVTCGGITGCQKGAYVVAETSFMRYVSYPVGDVNLRFSCCAFQALTKAMPSYCAPYDWANGNLLEYCKNDYQHFGGPGAYEDDDALLSDDFSYGRQSVSWARSGITTADERLYGKALRPKMVSLTGITHGRISSVVNEALPGLYRRQQVVHEARGTGVSLNGGRGPLLRVEITFSEGAPVVLLVEALVAVDVPPPEEEEQQEEDGGSYENTDVLVLTDVVDLLVDDEREVVQVAAKLLPSK